MKIDKVKYFKLRIEDVKYYMKDDIPIFTKWTGYGVVIVPFGQSVFLSRNTRNPVFTLEKGRKQYHIDTREYLKNHLSYLKDKEEKSELGEYSDIIPRTEISKTGNQLDLFEKFIENQPFLDLINNAILYSTPVNPDILPNKKGHPLDNLPKKIDIIMVDSSLFEKEKTHWEKTSNNTIAYHDRPTDDKHWNYQISKGNTTLKSRTVLVDFDDNQLRVHDGNHRLNVYLNKGVKMIPVVLTIKAKKYLMDLKRNESKKLTTKFDDFINESNNVKKVEITVPNETILKRINSTPTLKRLSRLTLKVGSNIETVNHYQYSEMMRMFPIVGCEITEL